MANKLDRKLTGNKETNLVEIGPEWQGFVQKRIGIEILTEKEIPSNIWQSRANVFSSDNQHKWLRFSAIGSSDEGGTSTSVRRNCTIGGSEGLGCHEPKPVKYDRSNSSNNSPDRDQEVNRREEVEDCQIVGSDSDSWRGHSDVYNSQSGECDPEQRFIEDALKERPNLLGSKDPCSGSLCFEGLSFPFSTVGDVAELKAASKRSFTSTNRSMVVFDGEMSSGHNMNAFNEILVASRRKSNESSPVWSETNGNLVNEVDIMHSAVSTHFKYENAERIWKNKKEENSNDLMEDGDVERVDEEEAASLQQLVQQVKAQEDQFETFDLPIVHRRNRTGYEEVRDYHAVVNTVIAGRYHVIQNIGSAVFSNVVQAHDLQTGMDVCLKIIKNDKEYFDQSLDEIKLLKFVNAHDPADKYHLLRLYNYFYHCEHLFIVCELLKSNLYEFYKFNKVSGGERYFTMPRLQSIAIQCLEALQFLHNLGLIHCDLKPENILMKSYKRCEVKIIDLGNSCFDTDHLSPTVQSRSYRAPEVILGLPYDKRIDIWSLGCILAELCLGNVLFENDSSATLLESIIAIIGPIDEEMLVMGHDTHTKCHGHYKQNQDTNGLDFLTLKTSLRHQIPMGDQGFIDFVSYLLQINPKKRPAASAALQHPWLSYTYEPIS